MRKLKTLFLMVCFIFFVSIMIISTVSFFKSEEDPIYQQSISLSYPIVSKKVNRDEEKITYKLNFKIESSFIFNNKDIYITKEEYDLLKKSNEIPFIVNTKTKSIKLDEEKFAELIKSLKDKEDTK
ncbi:hypothetical protein [Treponema denticola]|uniref:hypothetical protein n=1 Tax=Treponema denticola TaxID=158 RepID=UPI0002B4F39A|nr:hypothetical protein [Treponema denticola]EMB37574.1 hypothetical protein HMPREF9722_02507 [Treponema denticola ATCC 33520]UTC84435.1 hypothetical protein E4N91_01755 [Treponema denticola]